MKRIPRGRSVKIRLGTRLVLLLALLALAVPTPAAISPSGNVQPVYPETNPDPWNVGDALAVGDSVMGALSIDGGSDIVSNGGTLGFDPGVMGTITVTDTGSTWTNNQDIVLGVYGLGRLEVLAGATVDSQNAFAGHISGNGQVLVSGNLSQWNTLLGLFVGYSGIGSLTIQQQGLVRSGSAVIALGNSSSGSVVVDGQQSAWEVTNSLSVGDAINGGVAGLSLTGAGSRVYVGAAAVAEGTTLPIDHTAIVVSNLGTAAQLSVYEGNSIQNAGSAYVGVGAGESGAVVIRGVGTTWTNGGGVFVGMNGSGTLSLMDGGIVSSGGPVAIGMDGVVSGVGTIVGALSNAGLVRPGQSVGELTVSGSYSQADAGTLRIELAGTSAGAFDTLEISDEAILDGTLEVELGLSGGNPFLPQLGDAFTIVSAAAGITGAFSSADLPTLAAGNMWHIRYSANAATLLVKLAGDYNDDGTVDAADYTVWRDHLGNALDPTADGDTNGVVNLDDYDVWRANFGATSGAGALVAAVPEPTACAFAAILLSSAAYIGRLRRR